MQPDPAAPSGPEDLLAGAAANATASVPVAEPAPTTGPARPLLHWTTPDGRAHSAEWRSLAGHPPPAGLRLRLRLLDFS